MKKLLLPLLFYTAHAFCSEPIPASKEQPQPFASHAMAIFLDGEDWRTYNNQLEAFSLLLASTLEEKDIPLFLVSTSLVYNLWTFPTYEQLIAKEKNKSLKALYTRDKKQVELLIKTVKSTSSQGMAKTLAAVNKIAKKFNPKNDEKLVKKSTTPEDLLIRKLLYFNDSDWIIKTINQNLLLFIPKTYLQTMRQQFDKNSSILGTDHFSRDELALGIAFESFPTIHSLNTYIKKYTSYYQENSDLDFITYFPILFINRAWYQTKDNNPATPPTWAFYLVGHGEINSLITGLSIPGFQKFLSSLSEINTKLLAYSSCYAAGTNTETIYKNEKSQLLKEYPFPIAVEAFTDAQINYYWIHTPFFKILPSNIDLKKKRLKISSIVSFQDFIKETSKPFTNYPSILAPVFPGIKKKKFGITQSPLIKLPNFPWFNVIDMHKEIALIGSTMAQTRTKPLNVVTHFKRKPETIALQSTYIPFPLIIPMNTMPTIVSMVPGNTNSYFEEIAVDASWESFIAAFKVIAQSPLRRIFFIKKLVVKDKGKKTTFLNLVIDSNKEKLTFYQFPQSAKSQLYDQKKKKWNPMNPKTAQSLFKYYQTKIANDPAIMQAKATRKKFSIIEKELQEELPVKPKKVAIKKATTKKITVVKAKKTAAVKKKAVAKKGSAASKKTNKKRK